VVGDVLGLDPGPSADLLDGSRSDPYAAAWAEMADGHPGRRRTRRTIVARFAAEAEAYGYDAEGLTTTRPWRYDSRAGDRGW
jgi:hypothetical protein